MLENSLRATVVVLLILSILGEAMGETTEKEEHENRRLVKCMITSSSLHVEARDSEIETSISLGFEHDGTLLGELGTKLPEDRVADIIVEDMEYLKAGDRLIIFLSLKGAIMPLDVLNGVMGRMNDLLKKKGAKGSVLFVILCRRVAAPGKPSPGAR